MSRPITFSFALCLVILALGVSACAANSAAPAAIPAPTTQPVASPPPTQTALAIAATATEAVTPSPTLAVASPSSEQTPTALTITGTQQVFGQIAGAPHDTVVASDGSASLLIPKGALPPGKKASDITISPIDPKSMDVTINQALPLLAYNMQPDGLQFNSPVLLTITRTATTSQTVPILLTLSGDKIEALNPVSATLENTSGQLTLSVPVSHFSDIVGSVGHIAVKIDDVGTQQVQEPFRSSAEASLINDAPGKVSISNITMVGEWVENVNVDPANIDNAPPEGTALGGSSYTSTEIFTCLSDGKAELAYQADFTFDADLIVSIGGRYTPITAHENLARADSTYFDCKDKTPTPTRPPSTAPPPAIPASPPLFSVDMNTAPGGSQIGDARLTAKGDQTEVKVEAKPSSSNDPLPVSIQQSSCSGAGTVKYPLNNLLNGTSTTVIPASIGSLLAGNLSVHIGQSVNAPTKNAACGSIPQGAVIYLGTGASGAQAPTTAQALANTTLLAQGNQTMFKLYIGQKYGTSLPAAIYKGACGNLGSVAFKLPNAERGYSETTLNAPLTDLLKGGYVLAVGKSVTEPNTIVACGVLK